MRFGRGMVRKYIEVGKVFRGTCVLTATWHNVPVVGEGWHLISQYYMHGVKDGEATEVASALGMRRRSLMLGRFHRV